MRDVRLIEQFAVADLISVLNVEHRHRDDSPIVHLDAIDGRTCIFADELVFLYIVGFLANRLLSQREDMATLKGTALIEVPALEFGLRVQMVPNQAPAMRL